MISSDSCSKLVAGNYDILVNEPSPLSTQALKDFLGRFRGHQAELEAALLASAAQQQQQQQQQQQPQSQQTPLSFSYADEFKALKEFSTSLKEDKANLVEGRSELNTKKNRYKDIIPFSHTRVTLSNQAHQPDYINANYVRGPSGCPRAYIAAQGPLPGTVCDFWRMVWECGVSVIVMACNEYESGELKCSPYYPNQIGHSIIYGNLKVTLARVRQICSDFLIRKLTVSLLAPICDSTPPVGVCKEQSGEEQNNNSNSNNHRTYTPPTNTAFHHHSYHQYDDKRQPEPAAARTVLLERTICQFHYTTWPDHGVPNSVEPILELVRLMRDVQPSENKPILVHCSAGCGRTGTICCIDFVWGLLRRNKLNSNFNLWSIIRDMRQQRMSMVQTLEQYILCHKAVATLFINHLNLIDSSLYNDTSFRGTDNKTDQEGQEDEEEDQDDEDEEEDDDDDQDDDDEQDSSKSFNEQQMGPVLI